jgi:uncharacterized protein
MMSLDTLEGMIKNIFRYASQECTIAFQGGEPTLIGLDFYKQLIDYVQKYNKDRIKVNYAIQTNGYLINDEWAKFFSEHRFLVGLSLDGVKDTHDLYRIDSHGAGTYKTVMRTTQLFNNFGVDYNILTVVTANVAKNIGKIYGFYKKNNFRYQQYIPCLDPLMEKRGTNEYSLTPEKYAYFLKTLFDLWYYDVKRGDFIYIRYFENLVGILLGINPESCGMLGHCSIQYVVEADGGVYPCDFYVLDQYRIGNIATDSFETIEQNRRHIGFIEESMQVSEECRTCRWQQLCRGGCRRDREPMIDNKLSLNYFCSAYREFFEYAYERLYEVARNASSRIEK